MNLLKLFRLKRAASPTPTPRPPGPVLTLLVGFDSVAARTWLQLLQDTGNPPVGIVHPGLPRVVDGVPTFATIQEAAEAPDIQVELVLFASWAIMLEPDVTFALEHGWRVVLGGLCDRALLRKLYDLARQVNRPLLVEPSEALKADAVPEQDSWNASPNQDARIRLVFMTWARPSADLPDDTIRAMVAELLPQLLTYGLAQAAPATPVRVSGSMLAGERAASITLELTDGLRVKMIITFMPDERGPDRDGVSLFAGASRRELMLATSLTRRYADLLQRGMEAVTTDAPALWESEWVEPDPVVAAVLIAVSESMASGAWITVVPLPS